MASPAHKSDSSSGTTAKIAATAAAGVEPGIGTTAKIAAAAAAGVEPGIAAAAVGAAAAAVQTQRQHQQQHNSSSGTPREIRPYSSSTQYEHGRPPV